MAPDEDDDTFEHDHKFGPLTRICGQVTVYFNPLDLALHTSDKTKGNPDRLGTDGARVPGALPARIAQVDCSEVAKGAVKHSYYVDAERVVADAAAVLRGEHHADIPRRRPVEGMRVYRLR
jgi:esterase/lipase superfamily enzyme